MTKSTAPTLRFLGAAGSVTGSCFMVEVAGTKILVDCGMFQGSKTERELNYRPFPFRPEEIEAVVLTHAHIDHSGLLPKLFKAGYDGPIYATPSTVELCSVMLPDSGHIQESEVEQLNRRNRHRGRDMVEPIYTAQDAVETLTLFRPVDLAAWHAAAPGMRFRFWNAGHMLGSASVELELATDDGTRTILFSGDIGPEHKLLQHDPSGPSGVDWLVCESTYGDTDRMDATVDRRRQALRKIVTDARNPNGALLIPSFAVERTQELIYSLVRLMDAGDVKNVPIFIDSPLAIKVTDAFARHREDLHDVDADMRLFKSPRIRYTESVDESKAIARIEGGAIIMSASGMCDAGRIQHHLKANLWREDATVLFVGYQAPGSLGHLILSGEERARIHGQEIEVRCRIRRLDSYSAHADQGELVAWVKARLPVHNTIFLSHGDPEAMKVFREHLAEAGLDPARIRTPALDDGFDLRPGEAPAHEPRPARLSHARAAAARDWHNAYARLLLDLGKRLETLDDDARRETLLDRLRKALREDER